VAAGQKLLPKPALLSSSVRLETRRAHLVGVGGAGMRALAEVLLGRGWKLSGSDLATDSLPELTHAGLHVRQGHYAESVSSEIELVIHSDAVSPGNPELRRAAQLEIPTYSYFQMLGKLMSGKHGLAVAGTHGKSTTTAMAGRVLSEAGRNPTVLCGAAPLGQSSGGCTGCGELVLAEACEYRANFLHLRPRHAVILGIEPDHFDCYNSLQELEDAFARFARSVPPDGLILARHDCATTRRTTAGLPCRVRTFGIDAGADWSAGELRHSRGRYSFTIRRHGRHVCRMSVRVPGKHNVLNALAATALAWENGVRPEEIVEALGRFRGLHRRMEQLGTWGGVLLVDDYAHHPTEVTATLKALRQMVPGRRIWCVFQPHQVSRTERLLDELAASLQNADRVIVADIFRAREGAPKPGEVVAADLARLVRRGGIEVPPLHHGEHISRHLETQLTPGDVLITMGAGDIRRICDGLIYRFREDRAAG